MPPAGNPAGFRSGVVALIGAPNVGKSTLLNRLVGRRVAIATPVPQTTRTRARGVLTLPDAQLIFVDTPALHTPRTRLGLRMVAEGREAALDADVVLAVFDASRPPIPEDRLTADLVRRSGKPAVAAVNKTDRAGADEVARREREVRIFTPFAAVVPTSGAEGRGLDSLVTALAALLPEGPQYFPAEMLTDQPEPMLVRELIREQALKLTREEVPHGIVVEIEEFAPRQGGLTYIRATVHVERDAHKRILIGRDGRMLKEIGARARVEVERHLGRRVYLDLWVKVSKDWRTRDDLISVFYSD